MYACIYSFMHALFASIVDDVVLRVMIPVPGEKNRLFEKTSARVCVCACKHVPAFMHACPSV